MRRAEPDDFALPFAAAMPNRSRPGNERRSSILLGLENAAIYRG